MGGKGRTGQEDLKKTGKGNKEKESRGKWS